MKGVWAIGYSGFIDNFINVGKVRNAPTKNDKGCFAEKWKATKGGNKKL